MLCELHREVSVLYGVTARHHDLTLQQAELLFQMESGDLSCGELAKRLGCDKSNMTGMVDRLSRRGLLVRQADLADRRISKPALTEEGVAVAASIRAEFSELVNRRCAELAPADHDELARLGFAVAEALTANR